MKVAIIALLLTVSLAYTQCQVPTGSWGGYGGVGVYGGVYGLGYSGLLGSYHNLGFYGKRSGAESPETSEDAHMLKVAERTECVYTKDSGMLSCHGPTLIVECETILNWDNKAVEFSLYGIAKSDKMFRIIPRKLDNSGWSTEDNVYVYMKGEKNILNGLAIKEMECYAKLNELFEDSVRNEKVYLSEKEIVHIIGDLMVADKMPKMVIESLETKERQKRMLEEIMDRLDAIDEVLEEEHEETMRYKRDTFKQIEELEKKML